MRRFVRSYLVKRIAQYTVVHDDALRCFEVWCYTAETGLASSAVYAYTPSQKDAAREAALRDARAKATAAKSASYESFLARLAADPRVEVVTDGQA